MIPQAHCQAHISYSIIHRERDTTEREDRKVEGKKAAGFTLQVISQTVS